MTRAIGTAMLVAAIAVQSPPPVAQPALEGIIGALRVNQIVAISDPHGDTAMRDFLRQLINDPRFPDLINDVVLEIGNARYQSLVDDYVNGGAVDEAALADAWMNTTVANQISADVELFRTARRVNANRPTNHRLRLLLGDPPIDWSTVRTREDHFRWLSQRDSYPAALVQTEVIAKNRKALIVYGHGHYQRRNMGSNFEMGDWRAETIVSLIERAGPTHVFTIWNERAVAKLYAEAATWPSPALVAVAGTALGQMDVSAVNAGPRGHIANGRIEPLPKEQYARLPIEQQLDAFLYLGQAAPQPITRSAEPCSRPGFLEERLRRIAVSGIPQFEADAIRTLCSTPR